LKLEKFLEESKLRENILSWYPFKSGSSVLEIGENQGITEVLCKKCDSVYCIEKDMKKQEKIRSKYKNFKNLNILLGKEELKENQKFDYIAYIGYFEQEDNLIEELINIRKYLKEEGKILIAVDNKFGLKYFTRTNQNGENVNNLYEKKLFNLEELIYKIDQAGFKNKKVYYPMPDYKLTNVIFTDKNPLTKDELSRNIIYYDEDTIKFYDENELYRNILKENGENFYKIANSFFVEIFNGEFEENNIRLVTFSNMRKDEYKLITIVKDDIVYKYAENEKSIKHLQKVKKIIDILKKSGINTLDSYNDTCVISKYTKGLTVDKVIIDLLKNEKKQEAINLMKSYKEELLNKLEKSEEERNIFDKYNIKYNKEKVKSSIVIKYGLWDAIFQNCFYIDNQFYFYDQEWEEENVPLDFILYRAIKYFPRLVKHIPIEESYKIMGIDKEMLELYDELDDKIQDEIRNEEMWTLCKQGEDVLQLRINELTANHKYNLLNIENSKLINEIKEKDKQIEKLQQELNNIYNSKSWKITKPLREIRRFNKKR